MKHDVLAKPILGLVMPLATQQGGAERLFQNLLRAGSKRFQYTCLFLQDGPLVAEAQALGYETTVIVAPRLRSLTGYVKTLKALSSWIRRSRVDLVFSWMQKAHLYAAPAALLAGRKRMWFQHGIPSRHWMDLAGAWLPADGILCCSDYVRGRQGSHRRRCRSFVCHPGVPTRTHSPVERLEARERLGLAADAKVICMVARLERWKGAHVLVDAARSMASEMPGATFFIVGGSHPLDRAYASVLKDDVLAHTAAGQVSLMGQRPADEIPLWHASADVIAHPVVEAEPFGMAVVEAMAAGRAVIASNAGGISEIIQDGESGVLVQPGDAASLATSIRTLLQQNERREQIEAAAFLRAQVFSVEAFVTQFEEAVSSVLAA